MDRISEDRYGSNIFADDLQQQQQHDSGCALDTTPEDDSPSLAIRGRKPSASKVSLSRRERCRKSLRRLRTQSAIFFKKEMRPTCLKSSAIDELDSPRSPAVRRKTVPLIPDTKKNETDCVTDAEKISSVFRRYLVRQTELSSSDSLSNPRCPSFVSTHSEMSVNSESPTSAIWMKEQSTPPSPVLPPATPTPPSTPSSQPSPSTLLPTRVMNLYQKVLSSIVHPLGCPDWSGFSRDDLVSYLQELFGVDSKTHESVLADIQSKKPSHVVLNVTVVQARDLKPCCTVETTNPTCVLGVDASQSPYATPNSSPATTPSFRRKHRLSLDTVAMAEDLQRFDSRLGSVQHNVERIDLKKSIRKRYRNSLEMDELMHTETIKSTINPFWNEKFQLNVTDINSEALNLLVWHQPTTSYTDTPEKFKDRSRPSFKSLFRHLRLSQDECRSFANCLGQIRIALKDIPTGGCMRWFQLYRDKRLKLNQSGEIQLGLQLTIKPGGPSAVILSETNRVKEFHSVVLRIYDREFSSFDTTDSAIEESVSDDGPRLLTLKISQQIVRCVLSQFATYQNVSATTQKLLELAVILESRVNGFQMKEQFILEKIGELCKACRQDADEGDQLTDYERKVLSEAIAAYVRMVKRQLMVNKSLKKLFPPTELNLIELEVSTNVAKNLMNLPIDLGATNPSLDLTSHLTQHLQNDVREWLMERLETVQSANKDPVLDNTRLFVEVLRVATAALTPQERIAQFFNSIGVDYYRTASVVAEAKLSVKAKELTLEMNKYQVRYHRFEVNINESSSVSLQHYFALRNLFRTIRGNVNERELFRISLSDYQSWFKVSVTFWLQTFREQCLRRMETALKLDKDVVQVTSLVKHSNSSVDVLSCFATMTTEWREIDFADTDIALLGVTKITDTICDSVKSYMDKVIEIMEHNGYYDYIDNQQFDVTDQLCISLNNISHLSQYLSRLTSLLDWESVTQQLSVKHESLDVGQKALAMLHSLVETTNAEIDAQGRILAKQIIDRMAVDLDKYTTLFTRSPFGKTAEVEPLLDYLEKNMEVLFQKLESNLFPLFWEEIWKTEIRVVSRTLLEGRPASYYKEVSGFLESLRDFFQREGVENCRNKTCKLYCSLSKVLEMNSLSSEQLMLQYYKSLADVASTPSDYYGQLVVKVGYRPKTDDKELVTIYVKVVQAKDLPGMTKKNLSNPFVAVSLAPQTLFPETVKYRTPVDRDTVNPVYGDDFEFVSIPDACRQRDGAVIVVTAWHYIPLFSNDFIGEILIPIQGIREIVGRQTVDDLPAIMMPIRRPKEPKAGPYKVLKDRSPNDKVAQALLNQRNCDVVFRTRCNFCKPVKCLVSTLTGKRFEAIGKQASISTE